MSADLDRPKMSTEQRSIVKAAVQAAVKGEKLFIYRGRAGTGKTWVAAEICKALVEEGLSPVPCAFSGKATDSLRSSLQSHGVTIPARTVASLFRYPTRNQNGVLIFPIREAKLPTNSVVLLDEIGTQGVRSLGEIRESLGPDIPIIGFGDHRQTPPLFDKRLPELMNTPWELTQIFRQKGACEIPVFAEMVSEGDYSFRDSTHNYRGKGVNIIRVFNVYDAVLSSVTLTEEQPLVPILVGTNKEVQDLQARVREKLGYTGLPTVGELVMVQTTRPTIEAYNGAVHRVVKVLKEKKGKKHPERKAVLVQLSDMPDPVWLPENPEIPYWENEDDAITWDFGYVLTVAKAQGSEWAHVRFVIPLSLAERANSKDGKSLIYTAITRAKKHVDIYVLDFGFFKVKRAYIKKMKDKARRKRKRKAGGKKRLTTVARKPSRVRAGKGQSRSKQRKGRFSALSRLRR